MTTHDDTQEQLNDLEEEEQRIIRELHDLEERARADEHAKHRHDQATHDDPEGALATLLLECEKEVREAKGYIADHGPPLTIVRVRPGDSAPKGATYLSRPKNTGVDFTVPLTTRDYTSVIKRPMFLNNIRDKIKTRDYASSEDYLEDMRLLARNTAAFNKGPELSWVVQHARLLLEAAEDAVTLRRKQLYEVEDALRHATAIKQRSVAATPSSSGKRKRSNQNQATVETANGDTKIPSVGQSIEVYWQNYRRWFSASVVGKSGTNVHVIYDEDDTDQWIDLQGRMKWRIRNVRAAAASTKVRRGQEPPAPKRRKGSGNAHTPNAENRSAAIHVPSGPTGQDLEGLRSDISEKLEEISVGVTNQLKEHLGRIDRLLLRSDQMERVLLAVEDSRESFEDRIRRTEAWQLRIDEKLNKILSRIEATATKPLVEAGSNRGTRDENEGPSAELVDGEEVAAKEKVEVENSTVPNEVIVVDNSSADKQDSISGDVGRVGPDGPQRHTVQVKQEETPSAPERKPEAPGENDEVIKIDDKPADRGGSAAVDDEGPVELAAEESEVPAEDQGKASGHVLGGDSPVPMEVSSPVPSDGNGDQSKNLVRERQDEVREGTRGETHDATQDDAQNVSRNIAREARQEDQQDAIRVEKPNVTRDEAQDAVRDETQDAVRDETQDAVRDETQDAVRDETQDVVRDETHDAVRDETQDVVRDETHDAVRDETHDVVRDETQDAVRDETQDATRDEAKDLIPDEVKDASTEEAKEASPEEAVDASPEETKDASLEETNDASPEEAKDASPDEARNGSTDEAKDETQSERHIAKRVETRDATQEKAGAQKPASGLKETETAKEHGKADKEGDARKSVVKRENEVRRLAIGAVEDEESSDESEGSDDSDSDSSSSEDDIIKVEKGHQKEDDVADRPSSKPAARDDKVCEEARADDAVQGDVIGKSGGKRVDLAGGADEVEESSSEDESVDREEEEKPART